MKLLLLLIPSFLFGQVLSIDCGSSLDQYFTGGRSDFVISYPGAVGDLTLRYGAFQYHIPTSQGLFDVTLTIRETGTVSAAGQRAFSVSINGAPVLRNFDLFASAGLATLSRTYTVQSLGFIFIDFTYTKKSAIVSSITVEPAKPANVTVEPGFGIVSQLSSPNAATQKIAIDPVITLHRVSVPGSVTSCELAGAMAVDDNAQYLCVQGSFPGTTSWGHWVTFSRATAGSSIPVAGPGIIISQNPYTISIDGAELGAIFATKNGGNVFAPGKQVFQGTVTSAPLKITASERPPDPEANDFYVSYTGEVYTFNGIEWRKILTEKAP